MKDEKVRIIQVILHAITSLGTVCIAISIFISYYGIKQEKEWNQRNKTVELIGGFEQEIAKYRPAMLNYFRFLYFKGNTEVLSAEDAEKIWRHTLDNKNNLDFFKDSLKLISVRNQIVGLMNYLETLSQAYIENTVEIEIFEKSLAGPIILYHRYFANFIRVSQKEVGYDNWEPIDHFVKLIEEKKSKGSKPVPIKTGF